MWPKSYFRWLDGNSPKGKVDTYPILSENSETNLPGVFIIGDLTGIPLLKLAAESGKNIWKFIPPIKNDLLDVVIIGAGPSGVSCAIEAKRLGKKFKVLEANLAFQTIHSYPKGKPIFAEPMERQVNSEIKIQNGTKESLLASLNETLAESKISISFGESLTNIKKEKVGYKVITEAGNEYHTNAVVLAIGKSGNPTKLGVSGENRPNVFYRLFDPADTKSQKVVICGGGDSAIEAAISCSEFASSVTLVYRKKEFSRPKAENLNILRSLVGSGKIFLQMNSEVREILDADIVIKTESSVKKIPYDSMFVLIGTEPPIQLLKQLGIKIQNEKSILDYIGLGALISFASLAYFGKAAFYGPTWFFSLAQIFGTLAVALTGIWSAFSIRKYGIPKKITWTLFRNFYLAFVFFYFLTIYILARYLEFPLFGKYPSFHYTFLYSLTILVFGIRRMYIRRTEYIYWQTSCLIFIQIFFLFLLPEIILPYLGKSGYLGATDGFLRTQVFPNDAYWKAYGFILAWPLSLGVLYDSGLTKFWLVYGLSFTFLLIPFLVIRYGKGAYCGWICSCGGLAETLGDEHRQKMPHGKFIYSIEHSGQYILLFAFLLTGLKLVGLYGKEYIPTLIQLEYISDSMKWIYDVVVDIGLAGVIGVGLYFMFSGRIWCRAFCPLASLMHIYAKFSNFRIISDKKKCISCNICTKNCHQGIDVMGYANKGIPMDSVQCVRCSACVSLCPTNVLQFGRKEGSAFVFDTLDGYTRQS